MKVAVIGGGASGFFAAMRCKTLYPNYDVTIYEKSSKFLSKVKISGGGRCNVTNSESNIKKFSHNYPRGENQLKKLFGKFGTKETQEWFTERGVELVTQDDNCIFPKSQNSQTIIDCFLNECQSLGINLKLKYHFQEFEKTSNGFKLQFRNQENIDANYLIFSLGGTPKNSGYEFFNGLGYTINEPVPSLYTFNLPGSAVTKLMGVVVELATVKVQGTKLVDSGPLLITHWGMSGPAVLKTSAWGARILEELNYNFKISVNWLDKLNDQETDGLLVDLKKEAGNKLVKNHRPLMIPSKLWNFLLEKIGLQNELSWQNISRKQLNKLNNALINDVYEVKGKTTFKEEFVTCGGISLNDINMKTMESKIHPNVFFTGEFIDLDGITGGFNFQSAWTTGYIAGALGRTN